MSVMIATKYTHKINTITNLVQLLIQGILFIFSYASLEGLSTRK